MTEQSQTKEQLQAEENQLIALRKEKLAAIRAKGNAFPNTFRPAHRCADVQQEYADASREELEQQDIRIRIAGRIMLSRGPFMV
mgnify:FL=1